MVEVPVVIVMPPAQGEGRGAENAETAEGRCGIAFGDGRGRTNCYFITGLTRVRAGGVASARTRRMAGGPQVLKESELRSARPILPAQEDQST